VISAFAHGGGRHDENCRNSDLEGAMSQEFTAAVVSAVRSDHGAGRTTRLGCTAAETRATFPELLARTRRSVLSVMPSIDFEMLEGAGALNTASLARGLSMGSVTSEYDVHPAALPSRKAACSEQRWLADGLTDKFLILDERAVVTTVPGDGAWLITEPTVVELARRIWRDARARARPLDRFGTLTARQRAIALRLLRGDTDATIARVMGLSARTVANEFADVSRQLGAPSRFAAGYRLVHPG
jgi:DNA-binding CsgD family transcriptional regulator